MRRIVRTALWIAAPKTMLIWTLANRTRKKSPPAELPPADDLDARS